MKVGIYRDTAVTETGQVWLEDLRVGPSLASVQSPDSASSRIPAESDPANNPSAGGSSSSGDTLTWIAGGLLVVVVGLAVLSLRRRRTHG
jgi:MYXO-CTERM domain-containing protein